MTTSARRVFTRMTELAVTLSLAVVLGATLICLAPGAGVDERELDPRLTEQARSAIRAEREAQRNLTVFLPRYAAALARGDLGTSEIFGQPVGALLRERFPVTLAMVARGLGLAWLCAVAATLGARWLGRGHEALLNATGSLLCVPAALVALALVIWRMPVWLGIAVAVVPKIHASLEAILGDPGNARYAEAARARGVSRGAILARHVLWPAARPLAALAAVSVTFAIGASVAIESITDTPGIGQLAWKATTGRDVVLLVGLTLVLTAMTLLVNAVSEIGERLSGSAPA